MGVFVRSDKSSCTLNFLVNLELRTILFFTTILPSSQPLDATPVHLLPFSTFPRFARLVYQTLGCSLR